MREELARIIKRVDEMKGLIISLTVILMLSIAFFPVEGYIDSNRDSSLAQTFPPENYDFIVSLGYDDWDWVQCIVNYNDSLHGVFDVVPLGVPIDFFICDYDNLQEWIVGNTSIKRHTIYEDRDFAYWTFIPPYDALWFYVFVNKGDIDIAVWVMEEIDNSAPRVSCNRESDITYDSPVSISIGFTHLWFNISYYSVYLYESLLVEENFEPDSGEWSVEYSETFTTDDLQGTSHRLNFTGYTNTSAGYGIEYSFSIRIQGLPTSTSSNPTGTTSSVSTSEPSGIPVFGFFIIGSLFAVSCLITSVGERIRNRES